MRRKPKQILHSIKLGNRRRKRGISQGGEHSKTLSPRVNHPNVPLVEGRPNINKGEKDEMDTR